LKPRHFDWSGEAAKRRNLLLARTEISPLRVLRTLRSR
jgi:hypothetical protein